MLTRADSTAFTGSVVAALLRGYYREENSVRLHGKHQSFPPAQAPSRVQSTVGKLVHLPGKIPLLSSGGLARRLIAVSSKGSYLVDPASSHMLVSKIKPCMSKYKLTYTVKLRMAH